MTLAIGWSHDPGEKTFRPVPSSGRPTLQAHGQILIVGPSKTKLHFFRFMKQHDHALEQRIVGLETMDHPSDAQLVAHLRNYFGESASRSGVRE
jgi:hypothetical protein